MEESFKKALPIIETLNAAGYEAFFVGGSVRDVLLNRPIRDIDIATSALPQHVQALFSKTIPVGIEHGTVVVLWDNDQYEVTTYRIDGKYEDYRRPSEVEFVGSLEKDLGRRDFTINAIAMDKLGKIVDPYNGERDIQNRYIQTVGNPNERFSEDPLRMMRAVRFISQLDFDLCKETEQSILKNAELLKNISVERVLAEFEKLLEGVGVHQALAYIVKLNLYLFLPMFAQKKKELLYFIKYLPTNLKLDEKWSLLILTLNIVDIEQFFKEWKCSKQRIKITKAHIQAYQDFKQKGLLPYTIYFHGQDIIQSAIKLDAVLTGCDHTELLLKSENIYRALPIQSRKQLAVTGRDLLKWFSKQGGPWLSKLIDTIEKAVVNKEVKNSKAEIKEWLDSCNLL
ncbi:CCA tRNA nucleotidyltransferase [Bacillus sp. Marseille-P3661]|uniref:CCA tRNA nucleotidyltransferase n=1 Tax=Bacillus sp. Marseille-P3661 TaxID=1936234 RepID=UPI000C81C489|nr:CCA tRNA nucleotidyltransferase [Bacillus sp. Marseille-P3661]